MVAVYLYLFPATWGLGLSSFVGCGTKRDLLLIAMIRSETSHTSASHPIRCQLQVIPSLVMNPLQFLT